MTNLFRVLANEIWLMRPDYLSLAATVLINRELNIKPDSATVAKIQSDAAAREQRKAQTQPGTTAVIPVYGVLTYRGNMIDAISGPGSTSTQLVSAEISNAVADPNISKILLNFYTPGGSVAGIQELADEIYAARSVKPIIGIANPEAASAGIWLLAQCSEICITPSGQVGSIGVYTMHQCINESLKKNGIDVTLISAGEYKTEGNSYEPLSDEAKIEIKKRIDAYYQQFVTAVGRGRGISTDKVESLYGRGRMLNASQAKAVGLVDTVISYNELIKKLTTQTQRPRLGNAERKLQLAKT